MRVTHAIVFAALGACYGGVTAWRRWELASLASGARTTKGQCVAAQAGSRRRRGAPNGPRHAGPTPTTGQHGARTGRDGVGLEGSPRVA